MGLAVASASVLVGRDAMTTQVVASVAEVTDPSVVGVVATADPPPSLVVTGGARSLRDPVNLQVGWGAPEQVSWTPVGEALT
ncbi:hypothetical protein ABZP36_019397 [Zizania latifolia]